MSHYKAALPSFAAMFGNQEDCDVFFIAGDQQIGAHKAFVQARSVVLYEAIKKKIEQQRFNVKETAQQEVSEELNHLTLDQKSSEHCQLATQEEATKHENVLDQKEQTIPSEEKSEQQNPSSFGKTVEQEQEVPLQQEQQTAGSLETEQHQPSELQNSSSYEMTHGQEQPSLLESNRSHRATQGEKPILIIDLKFEVFKDILR